MKTITLIPALQRLVQCLLVGSLLSFAGTSLATDRITYYHNDALGSPVAATDASGTLLWREEYAPYGERLKKEASSKDTVWYTGKQEESTFGLSYFGARWYDPRVGRFMGVDPAGFSEDNIHSYSKYAYGNNNPYKYLDPDGNSPFDIGFFIADSIKLGIAINSGNPAAIQAAAADLAGSAIGLISPVPGTGQFIKGARAGSKLAKVKKGGDYSRPSGYRKGMRDTVWGNAKESSTGRVRDPKTGRFMSKDKAWDMGHKPGHEFKKHQQSAQDRGISRNQLLDEHNNPSSYRPELPSSNRSHKGEDKTGSYFGP